MLRFVKRKCRMMASHPNFWTCPRCGTTNSWGFVYCRECKNRRPE